METIVNTSSFPFAYPASRHNRKHGPMGYSDYESYRSWLRDEFCFRCVYCLRRERWGVVLGNWDIEHFVPQSHDPNKALDYENLLYACRTCNLTKSNHIVPNPCEVAFGQSIEVREDGTITALNDDGNLLIQILQLNDEDHTRFRRMIIETLNVIAQHQELFVQWMGYPEDLPDLSKLKPPGGNTRPQGIDSSYYTQRQQGLLPETY